MNQPNARPWRSEQRVATVSRVRHCPPRRAIAHSCSWSSPPKTPLTALPDRESKIGTRYSTLLHGKPVRPPARFRPPASLIATLGRDETAPSHLLHEAIEALGLYGCIVATVETNKTAARDGNVGAAWLRGHHWLGGLSNRRRRASAPECGGQPQSLRMPSHAASRNGRLWRPPQAATSRP